MKYFMIRLIHILLYIIIFYNYLLADEINISRKNAITNAVEIVSPSVVGINVTKIKQQVSHPFFDPLFSPFSDPFFEDFFKPKMRKYKVKNLGSGVIISNDGYIVTNSHVVENADEIIVSLVGGDTLQAKIIGFDTLTDIALIKINGVNLRSLASCLKILPTACSILLFGDVNTIESRGYLQSNPSLAIINVPSITYPKPNNP